MMAMRLSNVGLMGRRRKCHTRWDHIHPFLWHGRTLMLHNLAAKLHKKHILSPFRGDWGIRHIVRWFQIQKFTAKRTMCAFVKYCTELEHTLSPMAVKQNIVYVENNRNVGCWNNAWINTFIPFIAYCFHYVWQTFFPQFCQKKV